MWQYWKLNCLAMLTVVQQRKGDQDPLCFGSCAHFDESISVLERPFFFIALSVLLIEGANVLRDSGLFQSREEGLKCQAYQSLL